MTGREQQSEKRTGGAPVQRLQRGESGRAGLSLADRRKVSCSHVCTTGKLGRPLDGESKAIGGRHETQGTAAGSRLFRARPTGKGPLSSHTRDFRLALGESGQGSEASFACLRVHLASVVPSSLACSFYLQHTGSAPQPTAVFGRRSLVSPLALARRGGEAGLDGQGGELRGTTSRTSSPMVSAVSRSQSGRGTGPGGTSLVARR